MCCFTYIELYNRIHCVKKVKNFFYFFFYLPDHHYMCVFQKTLLIHCNQINNNPQGWANLQILMKNQ